MFFTVGDSLMQRVNDWSHERKNSNWLPPLITIHQGEYEEALRSGHIPAWSHKNTQGRWASETLWIFLFCLSFHPVRSHHSELNFSKDCHEINLPCDKCSDFLANYCHKLQMWFCLLINLKFSGFVKVQKSKYFQIIKSKHGLFRPREAN